MKMLNTFGLQLQQEQHGQANSALLQKIQLENQEFQAQSAQQLQQQQLNQLIPNEFPRNPVQFERTNPNRINSSLQSSAADLAAQQQQQQQQQIAAADVNYEQLVNHCSSLNGAAIAYCSSSLVNCQPQNLLLPQRNRIWMSQEGMPQCVVIDLRSLKTPPKSFKCVGFDCWHDYSSNPQTLELAVSVDGSHFITWITFKAPLIIVKETHGASKVYMNSLYLLEEAPIPMHYFGLTQSTSLQKAAAQALAGSTSQLYSHQSQSQQQQTQSTGASGVMQLEQQAQQGIFVALPLIRHQDASSPGIPKQPLQNTYNNGIPMNRVVSPTSQSQTSPPLQHNNLYNNSNNPQDSLNNYWSTFTAVDNNTGSKHSQEYDGNHMGITHSFNQQTTMEQQRLMRDQYIHQQQQPQQNGHQQQQYGSSKDTGIARQTNNYSSLETMTDPDKLVSQRESISQQAQNHRQQQFRFEKESNRYDTNMMEMPQPIRVRSRKEQQYLQQSQESQNSLNEYQKMDNRKQQRISQGLLISEPQHDSHLNQSRYEQTLEQSNQKAHTTTKHVERNGWNNHNNSHSNTQLNNNNSVSSLISFNRNSHQQQQFLINSHHKKQNEESQLRSNQKNNGNQSRNDTNPYDHPHQYSPQQQQKYRFDTNTESYEDPRNQQSPGKQNSYVNARNPKNGYYPMSRQPNHPSQELEYQLQNDDAHRQALFLGSPKRKWSSKIPQSREDARSFLVDASLQSQSVSHLYNSTPKQYSQQQQRVQYSNTKHNEGDDIKYHAEEGQYSDKNAYSKHPQLRSQRRQSTETQEFGQELLQTQLQVAKLVEIVEKTQEAHFLAVDKISMLSKSLQDMESKVTVQLQVIQSEFKHNQEDLRVDKDDKDKGTREKKEGRNSELKQSGMERKEVVSSRADQEMTEKKDKDSVGKNREDEGEIKDSRMRSSELNFKQSLQMEQIVEKAVEEKMETLEHSLCHLLLNSISRVQHSNNKHIQEDEDEDDQLNEHLLKRSKQQQHKGPLVISEIKSTPQKCLNCYIDYHNHQQKEKSTSRQLKMKQQKQFDKEEIDSQTGHNKGQNDEQQQHSKGMKRVLRLLEQLQDKLDKRDQIVRKVADLKIGGKSVSTSNEGKYHQHSEKSNLNYIESSKNHQNGRHHHSPGIIRAAFGKHS